jgi:hypothetical protein
MCSRPATYYHGESTCHRFHRDIAEGFRDAREEEQIAGGVVRSKILAAPHASEDMFGMASRKFACSGPSPTSTSREDGKRSRSEKAASSTRLFSGASRPTYITTSVSLRAFQLSRS